MKRATIDWLKWQATDTDQFGNGAEARDALASDAEAKRLRAALEDIASRINSNSHLAWAVSREAGDGCECVSCTARAALKKPKVKR